MTTLRTVVLFGMSTAILWSQSLTSLNGVVIDPSGGVMAGAVVEIPNLDTSTKRSVISDAAGLYSFNQVAPDRYRLTAQAPGFSVATIDDVQLVVNTPSTIAIKLQVGAVTESVAVLSEAVQVNTMDASLGNAITTNAIVELPFEARNPASLLALQPGVTYFGQGSTYGRPVTGTPGTADRLNGPVNGSKPDQNNITLDGVDVNDQNTRNAFQSVLRVTLDSVQEFRTTTQNPTAEQGRGSGAQIALVTKSGTNDLHGSLYEYHRNTLTSANSFFNNRSGVPRQKLIRNTFGTSLGGPIKKNRLFYFLNYEGRRDASDGTATRLAPTASMRAGVVTYLNTLDSSAKNTVFWRGNLQNDNLGGLPQFPGQAASVSRWTTARAMPPVRRLC
jgi:hypothetical protein